LDYSIGWKILEFSLQRKLSNWKSSSFMKPSGYFRFTLGVFCFHSASASAATLVSNTFVISTTIGATTDTTAPTTQTVGSFGGTLDSTATAALVTSPGDPSNLLFDLVAPASVIVNRPPGGNGVNSVSAFVLYTFAFSLGASETKTANFNLNYALTEAGINGAVTWALTGPSGPISAISSTLLPVGDPSNSTQTIASTSIPTQTTTLSGAGTYTFTLRAQMPSQTVESNKAMSLIMNDANLSITTVPESSCLGVLSLALLAMIRRR
jgi:hypothetical protein